MAHKTITRDDAERIANKLGARLVDEGRPHILAIVYYQGKRVASFGIRRSSKRDKGHGHIPRDLNLTFRKTRDLADCPMSFEDWIEEMKEKGIIEEEEEVN